jgi:secreted PhoX family phosphatase
MQRRQLLRAAAVTVGAAATSSGLDSWAGLPLARAMQPGSGPYGPLSEPDSNGIRLPEGFESRVIARSGRPVPGTSYPWHVFPDGGATFPTDDGGWIYTSNSEVPVPGGGGVSALRFDSGGEVADAYRILSGTQMNCAGGPTPWGTWLSCEEHDGGRVWECDPYSPFSQGVVREAMGTFTHEAAAVDPSEQRIYLTEDVSDGGFYRFTPARYPDLSEGRLEIAVVDGFRGAAADGGGSVSWVPVPDPNPDRDATTTRSQLPESTAFDGGEGVWYAEGSRTVFFATKGDHRVWAYRPDSGRLEVIYDAGSTADPPIYGVDNVTVASGGDIYVAEDPDGPDTPELAVMLITSGNRVSTFAEVVGQPGSELTGPAFDPAGDRLYLSSQRGGPFAASTASAEQPGSGFGITYEITGPFRGR